jgi:hypothetical protein
MELVPSLPQYVFVAWFLVTDRENFTFIFHRAGTPDVKLCEASSCLNEHCHHDL